VTSEVLSMSPYHDTTRPAPHPALNRRRSPTALYVCSKCSHTVRLAGSLSESGSMTLDIAFV
jgi:hypothetical protein